VLDLLEPVLGRDNVRATVSADIDFSQVMQTAEAYRPNQGADAKATVREQRSEESVQPAGGAPGGVPGATSNQPPTPATAPINGPAQQLQGAQAGGANANTRKEAATRFEVDKTTTVTRNAVGSVRRLSAAVVVNHRTSTDAKGKTTTVALPDKEIEQLTALVQQGIGFNVERGDVVKLINAPFRVEAAPAADDVPLWKQPWLIDLLKTAAAPAALALVALVIVFKLIRPAMSAMLAPPPPPPETAVGGQLNEVVEGEVVAAQDAEKLMLDQTQLGRLENARAMARNNPAAVAHIVRGWVNGEVS
jgi:flagellar M-ring protein FliF